MIVRTNSSAPSTAIPSNRNGSNSSHTIGYSTRASKARGQHRTSRMHQSRKPIHAPPPYDHNTIRREREIRSPTQRTLRSHRIHEKEGGHRPFFSTRDRCLTLRRFHSECLILRLPNCAASPFLQNGLRCRQPRNRYAKWRRAHIIHSHTMAELHALRIAAVLAANANF